MTVVYIDSVFLLNGLVDYLLLLLTARLAGLHLHRRRYALAGVLGGAYASAVFLPWGAFLSAAPVKLAAGILLALTAFGGEDLFFRLTLLFFGLSCAFAGGVLGLGLLAGRTIPQERGIFYTNIDAKLLVITATAAYLLVRVIFMAAAKQGIRGQKLPVTICVGEKRCTLTALLDSGNGLQDFGGAPVLVAERPAVAELFPPEIRRRLERGDPPAELVEPLRDFDRSLQPQLLSYRSVGQAGGLLLSVRSRWTKIGGTTYPALRIAVSPTPLGAGFQALWGGAVERGKEYEDHGDSAWDIDASGSAAAGGNSLHRRQRHASAAAGEGAGGGIAGLSGSGGGPERADRA